MINLGRRQNIAVRSNRKQTLPEVEILAYISGRSGGYDEIEIGCIDDPYADGYIARNDGISLEDALTNEMERRKFRPTKARIEYRRLITMGWNDAG